MQANPGILVDHELEAGREAWFPPTEGQDPLPHAPVQPTSQDLVLASSAYRVPAGFLAGARPVAAELLALGAEKISLAGPGAVLERGSVTIVPLAHGLCLPSDLRARFNPRSSTGRLDLFTRVLVEGHSRFDEAPPGTRASLWIEICPLSFPVRLKQGDRLCQVRLARGRAELTSAELEARAQRDPLLLGPHGPLSSADLRFDGDGGLALSLGFQGRDPVGWRARSSTPPVTFDAEGVHDPRHFFEEVHARQGRCVLAPGSFHIFASRERIVIPPDLCAEMLPVDTGLGELRTNYAGFFDAGFGFGGEGRGTPAVLEVRAHDVPFLVEDGQAFCRLKYFRTSGPPARLYGRGRSGRSYQHQDLTLARVFRSGPR